MTSGGTGAALRGSPGPLTSAYDVALVDLDGVVYRGPHALPGAAVALGQARAAGLRLAFVTNNATRSPAEVAAHLRSLSIPADARDVVTAGQAAVRVLRRLVTADARVLCLGTDALRDELTAAGFSLVRDAGDEPAAVMQGLAPDATYAELADVALAVAAGAVWVATNVDATLPTARGLLPGNGALVALVATATGRSPVVAGKPERALHDEAVRRTGAQHPLVVGDRLDTDVAGALRAGCDSVLVLTGVTDAARLLAALPGERPTYVALDLGGLLLPQPEVQVLPDEVRCRGWTATVQRDGALVVTGDSAAADDGLDALRAAAVAVWRAADAGHSLSAVRGLPVPSTRR